MKYILFDDGGVGIPVLFPSHIDHRAIANRWPDRSILGAGFVVFQPCVKSDTVVPYCHGESTQLQIKSRGEQDAIPIRIMLREGS